MLVARCFKPLRNNGCFVSLHNIAVDYCCNKPGVSAVVLASVIGVSIPVFTRAHTELAPYDIYKRTASRLSCGYRFLFQKRAFRGTVSHISNTTVFISPMTAFWAMMSTNVALLRTIAGCLPYLVSIAASGVSTRKGLTIRLSLMQTLHLQMHKA